MSVEILVTDTYHEHALSQLKVGLNCRIRKSAKFRPTLEEMNSSEVLLIRSRTRVDQEFLEQAPFLKLIVSATSGFDHIDFHACLKKNITVAYTPQANVVSASELTLSLLLGASRHLIEAHKMVEKSVWKKEELRGRTLDKKSLGLIGCGRIGQRVAALAHGFGMKVVGYDPYVEDQVFADLSIERFGLLELLMSSDFVSLHVPLTQETHHMVNYQTLRRMNHEAWLINVSRGAVVDETALATALDEGVLCGAALDVFECEPLGLDSRLMGRKNVLMTPHIGALTEEALEEASLEAIAKVISFFNTGQVTDTLPLSVPWFKFFKK